MRSNGELDRERQRYLDELRLAGLTKAAVSTYGQRAGRFLGWLSAQPNAGGGPDPEELTKQLDGYEASLGALSPATVATYVDGADRFISWLAGEYHPRVSVVARTQVQDERQMGKVQPVRPVEDDVLDILTEHLKRRGWAILAKRSAASREHGVDIEARMGERRLLVEAKGWPADTYVRGVKAGQPRAYLPYTQGRAYFSNALLPTLIQWSEERAEVAIALPRRRTYMTLIDRTAPALRRLGVGAYLIDVTTADVELRLEHRRSDAS
jgi:hypothetical protein